MILKAFCFCVILLFHSIEISQCNASLNELGEAILAQRYQRANQLIQSRKLTVRNWLYVFRNVNVPKPLTDFGLQMNFNDTKLLYYTTFLHFLEFKKEADPKIRELSDMRNKPIPNDFELRARSNQYLEFLKLEQQIKENLEHVFGQYFINGGNSVSSNVLKGIDWYLQAKVEFEFSRDGQPLLVQNVANQALLKNYEKANISLLIDRAESIGVDTNNNKFLKTFILTAIHNALHEKKDDDQTYLFKLAYAVKRHYPYIEHSSRDGISTNMYLGMYANKLMDSFHGCVKSIINQRDPEKVGYLIRSKKYDEYLYAADGSNWKTQAADVDKSTYRAIFAWIPKNDMNAQGQWVLVFQDDRFWIKNAHYGTYLDTSSAYTVHASTATGAPELKAAVRIIPSQSDSESCYIENYSTHRRIYAGGNDKLEDNARRAIYTGEIHMKNDDSVHWTFSTFKSLP